MDLDLVDGHPLGPLKGGTLRLQGYLTPITIPLYDLPKVGNFASRDSYSDNCFQNDESPQISEGSLQDGSDRAEANSIHDSVFTSGDHLNAPWDDNLDTLALK